MADREKRSATIAIRRGPRKGPVDAGAEDSISVDAETLPRSPAVDEALLARRSRGEVDFSSAPVRIIEERAGEKLAVTPLSVLLPRLGNLSGLHAHRDFIEERFEAAVQDAEQTSTRELAMLKQLLHWMSLEGGEGG